VAVRVTATFDDRDGSDCAGRIRRWHQFARRGERPSPAFRSRPRSPQIVRARFSSPAFAVFRRPNLTPLACPSIALILLICCSFVSIGNRLPMLPPSDAERGVKHRRRNTSDGDEPQFRRVLCRDDAGEQRRPAALRMATLRRKLVQRFQGTTPIGVHPAAAQRLMEGAGQQSNRIWALASGRYTTRLAEDLGGSAAKQAF
jgi:hypothetical protein